MRDAKQVMLELLRGGEDWPRHLCPACGGRRPHHMRECVAAEIAREAGGEKERQRQVDAAHKEAIHTTPGLLEAERTQHEARRVEDSAKWKEWA